MPDAGMNRASVRLQFINATEGKADSSMERNATEGLQVLASGAFGIEGDVYKLVTFLNQTLKEKGFTFGMSKHPDGIQVTVYQTTADRSQ